MSMAERVRILTGHPGQARHTPAVRFHGPLGAALMPADQPVQGQEAIELPRFLSGRFSLGEARDTLHIEGRFPSETIKELEARDHIVNRWEPWNERAGHAHGITIDATNGALSGGSDPRSDGAAIGY